MTNIQIAGELMVQPTADILAAIDLVTRGGHSGEYGDDKTATIVNVDALGVDCAEGYYTALLGMGLIEHDDDCDGRCELDEPCAGRFSSMYGEGGM